MNNSPDENTKNTPNAATNSHLEGGDFSALYFLSVGDSAFFSLSSSNNLPPPPPPPSTNRLRGAAMEIDGADDVVNDSNRLLGADELRRILVAFITIKKGGGGKVAMGFDHSRWLLLLTNREPTQLRTRSIHGGIGGDLLMQLEFGEYHQIEGELGLMNGNRTARLSLYI